MSDQTDLTFKDDPGAVRHGNFINYYQFHGAQDRLNAFPRDLIRGTLQATQLDTIYALDLGCNTGEITQGLYQLLCDLKLVPDDQVKVLGVDIDPQLIKRAAEANTKAHLIQYVSGNLMELLTTDKLQEFTNGSGFQLTTCLSITMWIHLNNGDAGLQSYLKGIAEISEVLVVEPQRWKSYKDAVRRMKRGAGIPDAFPQFPQLKWRETVEQDIQKYLESSECNMRLVHQTDPLAWSRTISVDSINYNHPRIWRQLDVQFCTSTGYRDAYSDHLKYSFA